tara:strand:- start:33899 stop:34105 length:207 start_codon:yes stop_codon:yes gene_type:complete
MTETQKKRVDELSELGMVFNGESYVGRGDNSDFNAHHTEFMLDSDEIWEKKISKLKVEKRNRELNKII